MQETAMFQHPVPERQQLSHAHSRNPNVLQRIRQ